MASGPYMLTLQKVLETYFESGTFYGMLIGSYTENRDTHEFLTSVRSAEIANGNGYTTNGKVVVPTVTFTSATNVLTVTFPQLVWTTATISAQGIVYYKELGADSVDELCFVNKFGSTINSTNDDFTVPASTFTWDFSDTD
jgi:hypothetical protein